MGMSSSQARLLNLTARMHQIEYKAAKLEAQKLQMANESRRVYDEYLQALDAHKVQFMTLTSNGSVEYADATLSGLENSIVHDTSILTSTKAYLLHNANTNEIYLTKKVADVLGVSESGIEPLPDKRTFLNSKGVFEIEELGPTANYNDVSNISPLRNGFVAGYTDPDVTTYSVLGTFTPASIDPASGYVETLNTMPTMSVVPYSETEASYNTTYAISSGTTYKKLDRQVFTFTTAELDMTLQQLSTSKGWGLTFGDANDTLQFGYMDHVVNGIGAISTGTQHISGYKSYDEDGDITNGYHYDSTTTLREIVNWINNQTGVNSVFSESGGQATLTVTNGYVHTKSCDDSSSDNKIGAFIKSKSVFEYETTENTLSLSTNLKDLMFSNRKYNNTYEDLLWYSSDGTNTLNMHYSPESDLNNITLGEYFAYVESHNSGKFSYTQNADGSIEYTVPGEAKSRCMLVQLSSSTTQTTTGSASITKGSITNVPSTTDIKEYFAYQMYSSNTTGPTYNEHLAYLNGLGYDDYQWASIYYSKDAALTTKLYNHNGISSYINSNWDSDHYVLTQNADDNYQVGSAVSTTVSSPSRADIILKLAEKMHDIDTSTEIPDYKTQLESQFSSYSDNQLASLSTYYNNSTEWYQIASKLLAGNSIASYMMDLSSYTVSMQGSNALTLDSNTVYGEVFPDTIQIPSIEGIASNLVVAFRDAGYTDIEQDDVVASLNAKYGTDNAANNATLANINVAVCEYFDGTGSVTNLYNHIYNNSALSITNTYTASSNNYSRSISGVCGATYGTQMAPTGNWVWNTKDPNYIRYSQEYDNMVELRKSTVTYKIIDDDLANSKEYLNNLLADDAFALVDFSHGLGEDMIHTSISVETSLREESDESNLRKAEAKYEADMRKIDRKDRNYDTQLAALDNERNAVKSEMETLKNVAKDNVERTFKLFG